MSYTRLIVGGVAAVVLVAALAGCQADSAPKYYLKPKDPDASTIQTPAQPGAVPGPGAPGAPPGAVPPR